MENSKYPQFPILLVDDEEHFLNSVNMTLSTMGINNLLECQDSRNVMNILGSEEISVLLMDLTMPHITGEELVPIISKEYPEIPIIVITAVNQLEIAVTCMKNGAFDYILKPVDKDRILTSLRHALEMREIKIENSRLKRGVLSDKLRYPEAFHSIVTCNKSMHSIFKYLEAVSGSSLPIMITGETGSGKEQIAHTIHNLSGRNGEFVALNVGGLDGTLFSDTLFGHKKGAFSGADVDRKGMLEEAEGGTLFLDEIGDLNIECQIKLLRLLQEGRFFKLGSDVSNISDARIVVATHQDLETLKEKDVFREDLYYRLQYHHVQLPPLRDRKEDIPLLVDHFLEQAAQKLGKKKPAIPKELNTLLKLHHFPGNIRELETMVYDALSQHEGGILSMNVFRERTRRSEKIESKETSGDIKTFNGDAMVFPENLPTLKEIEKLLIGEALDRVNGNQTMAANILGLSRQALNNRIQRNLAKGE